MSKRQETPALAHSVEAVAHMLSCHRATIWRMIACNQLPVIKIGPNGGLTRIPDSAVQALVRGKSPFQDEQPVKKPKQTVLGRALRRQAAAYEAAVACGGGYTEAQ